jgi:hypothetical protein
MLKVLDEVKRSQSVRWNQRCWMKSNEVEMSDGARSIRWIQTKLKCQMRSEVSDEIEQSQNVGQSQMLGSCDFDNCWSPDWTLGWSFVWLWFIPTVLHAQYASCHVHSRSLPPCPSILGQPWHRPWVPSYPFRNKEKVCHSLNYCWTCWTCWTPLQHFSGNSYSCI